LVVSLGQFFRDEVSNPRWSSVNVKGQGALFCFAIFGCDSFVLAEMLSPRFSHKDFQVSFRVSRVAQ
jgi:hypothetical protein